MRKFCLWLVILLAVVGFQLSSIPSGFSSVDAQDGECPQNPLNFNPVIGQTLIVDEPNVTGHATIGGRKLTELTMGELVQVISMPECDDLKSWIRVNYQGESLWVVSFDNHYEGISELFASYFLVPNDYEESVLVVSDDNPRCPQDPLELNLRSGLEMVVDEANVFTYQTPYGDRIQLIDIGTQVRLTGHQLCYDTELWAEVSYNGQDVWVKILDNNTHASVGGGIVATYHLLPQENAQADNQSGSSQSNQPSAGSSTYQLNPGYRLELKSSLENNARTITILEAGDQVTLIETVESDDIVAAQVRYQGQTGWVLFSAGGVNYFRYID